MRSIIWLFAIFAVCPTSAAQEVGYLDLTTQVIQPRRTEPSTGSGTGGGVGAGDGVKRLRSEQPLRLTISYIEGAEHPVGGELIYEVKLLNTSQQIVKIPWTPSPRDIEPARPRPYKYQMASLSLRLANSGGQTAALETSSLVYGSDAPSTILELAPGHWVRIRATTRLNILPPGRWPSFLSPGQNKVNVEAVWRVDRVSFAERNGRCHETFTSAEGDNLSTNTIPVEIRMDAKP